MGTLPGRMKRIAEERGEELDVLIPRLLEKHGSILRVAMDLGVSPNSVRVWLDKNGYQTKTESRVILTKAEPTNA